MMGRLFGFGVGRGKIRKGQNGTEGEQNEGSIMSRRGAGVAAEAAVTSYTSSIATETNADLLVSVPTK